MAFLRGGSPSWWSMAGDATSPPPELPPGLLAEYLESARGQLSVLAGLAERLGAAGGGRGALGPPPRPAPRPPTQRPVARPARIVSPPLPPKPATPSPNGPGAPVVASADAVLVPEVIYVEDDAALAELLEYGLRAHGYRFLAYRNGREALRELLALDVRGTHPLLLLDVDLPALDGYSILGALERERPGTYRVVFTTVHGTEEEQLRGLEAGALDYLVKPISLRVALEKIKRWVGGGRGGRGGR